MLATVIAIGTSVPELAASVIAAAKKEKALSLGNLIGSNIFNIGSVLGITSMIKAIPVTDPTILNRDIIWMLSFAAVLSILILMPKRFVISRVKGLVLVYSQCTCQDEKSHHKTLTIMWLIPDLRKQQIQQSVPHWETSLYLGLT